jgi:hypothetical protein
MEFTFVVKESAEGKPWIAAEPNSDIANARVIGFELVPETTLDDAAEIAKFMRKHIRGITGLNLIHSGERFGARRGRSLRWSYSRRKLNGGFISFASGEWL